jgi:hypothetical protein
MDKKYSLSNAKSAPPVSTIPIARGKSQSREKNRKEKTTRKEKKLDRLFSIRFNDDRHIAEERGGRRWPGFSY